MTMVWNVLAPVERHKAMLGYIPSFFSEDDPRSATDQINDRYAHGGGWHPLDGVVVLVTGTIVFPGDDETPATTLKPIAMTRLREETIFVYPGAFVMIYNKPTGKYEVAMID